MTTSDSFYNFSRVEPGLIFKEERKIRNELIVVAYSD